MNFTQIPAHKFTYELWRNGCLEDVGIFTRTASIKENIGKIANMVIGYCDAGKLYFRAKPNCMKLIHIILQSCSGMIEWANSGHTLRKKNLKY